MKNTYQKITEHFAGKSGVETGRMFGSEGLKISGKVFAMDVKEKLVVKLPAARANLLVTDGSARLFDPGHGRLLKEWVEVDVASKLDWLALAVESFTYVKAGAKNG
jgi:TfoX/Sxy family transcriptional regulator of competence genes